MVYEIVIFIIFFPIILLNKKPCNYLDILIVLFIMIRDQYYIMKICTDMKLRSRNFSMFMTFPSEQGKYRIKMISNAFPLSAVRKTIRYAYKNNKKERRCFLVVKTTNVS